MSDYLETDIWEEGDITTKWIQIVQTALFVDLR
jgi:hypothetical protein